MTLRQITIFSLFALCFVSGIASAHSSGASFEAIVGDYRIDIGYDPIQVIAGDRAVFDFELWNVEKTEALPFTRVWARLERDGKTVLATGVGKPLFGSTTLLAELVTPGEWTLHARYEQGETTLVENSFPFTVSKAPINKNILFGTAGGAILLAVGGWLLWRRHRRSQ